MDEQPRPIDNTSANGSDQPQKRRPSLFPIRNSAKRKSSISENKHIFDPHDTASNSNRLPCLNLEKQSTGYHDRKSETQFEYRSPSGLSDYSSPRSSRSSPKDFIADTPFVPFVHQSLSKTVWQSQQVILQEKDDIDRKQSQTQIPKNNDLDPHHPQIQNHTATNTQNQQSSNPNQYSDGDVCQYGVVKKQVEEQGEGQGNSGFQTCQVISISVPAGNVGGQGQGQGGIGGSDGGGEIVKRQEDVSKKNQIVGINEEIHTETSHVEYQIQNQIQHNQYVSKAHIFQQQQFEQQRNLEEQEQRQQHFFPIKKQPVIPKFSFSYIDCISIRSVCIPVTYQQQQTSPKKLTISQISSNPHIHIPAQKKTTQETSTSTKIIHLSITNPSHSQIRSTKKQNTGAQTYKQRLEAISKSYDEKIGIHKMYTVSSQQSDMQRIVNEGVQTQKYVCMQEAVQTQGYGRKFGISQQINYSVCYNYTEASDKKLEKLENYIKNMYEKKQAEIQQIKQKKAMDMYTNTQKIEQSTSANASPSPIKSNKKKIIMQDNCCQYDEKDLGVGRSSLKRVSIAAAPVIYEIDESNSVSTFQIEQLSSKRSSRSRGKHQDSKSKGKKDKIMVKLEHREPDTEEESEYKQEQVKKSKRKGSKTPKKKNKN